MLKKELEEDPPEFNRAMVLLEEIKDVALFSFLFIEFISFMNISYPSGCYLYSYHIKLKHNRKLKIKLILILLDNRLKMVHWIWRYIFI